jgi:alpha-galactosidase
MTKIAFIGGGSLQWTPGLVNDMALTRSLDGAELVLCDINFEALKLMTPLCKGIVAHQGSRMQVRATLDRRDALLDADFVVLCVSVGGLEAMRQDLEIPLKYGIHQSVGDTVGPGGLARALRHIPFAVQVAREMGELCPEAWLLNLTNPMTTICRAVSKATGIRTLGLCHEVGGVRHGLTGLFGVSSQDVLMEVAGINHLPVILSCRVNGEDGFELLRSWLNDHDPFEYVEDAPLTSPFQVFRDYLAVKLWLFSQTGVLYGAGDRHVAEFFPGFLNEANQFGRRFGVQLTTVDHRLEMARQRRADLESFVPPQSPSDEQLAPLMGALVGGAPGQFVVNLPNRGQVDNLPRQAVVECLAYADRSGVWPISVGELPPAVHAVVAPHVDRQELIVEAALTGRHELARAALATDPLVDDPLLVAPLFDELMTALARFTSEEVAETTRNKRVQIEAEIEALNAQPVTSSFARAATDEPGRLSVANSTIQELLDDPGAREVLESHFPGMLNQPQLKMAYGMTLKQVAPFAPDILTEDKLDLLDRALGALAPSRED